MRRRKKRKISVSVIDRGDKGLFYRWRSNGRTREQRCEAQTERQALRDSMAFEKDLNRAPEDIRWEEFTAAYTDQVVPTLAASTQRHWWAVAGSIVEELEPAWLDELDARAIAKWQAKLGLTLSPSTVKSYTKRLVAALNWAHGQQMLPEVPEIAKPKPPKASKGRAISGEEFDRLIAAVEKEVTEEASREWERILRGLWWSGLRLGELLDLRWAEQVGAWHVLHLDGNLEPMLIGPASQKAKRQTQIPCPAEFAELLRQTPKRDRVGRCFAPLNRCGNVYGLNECGKIIRRIGKRAGVIVHRYAKPDAEGKPRLKYASAQDLRRSFATRWAKRLQAVDLARVMRHASVETTRQFYVSEDTQDLARRMRTAK